MIWFNRNNAEFIYAVLGEEVDPEDGIINIILLDLEGGTREWRVDQIRKVYRVIGDEER